MTANAYSSPVAGTIFEVKDSAPEPGAPVAAPVTDALVAQVLREVAQALLERADTLAGGFSAHLPKIIQLQNSVSASLPHFPHDVTTVTEVVNEFLSVKAKANRSDRYLRALRVSLSSFARGRARVPLATVTASDVEKWVYGLNVAPRTMKGYMGDVCTMLNYAQRRGYVLASTIEALRSIDLPENQNNEAPGIHTPAQVRAVLEHCRLGNLDACRHLAVRYFAGLRSAEAHRLRDENIWFEKGLIEVPASKSKTKSRRLVRIQPCLAAWLALGGTLRNICPQTIRVLVRGSGVEWPPNVTRHSFVSYHLAQFENAGKTALEAGHAEQILFAHYRALVTPDAAQEFWDIKPL